MTTREFLILLMVGDALFSLLALAFPGEWHRPHGGHGVVEFIGIVGDALIALWAYRKPCDESTEVSDERPERQPSA